MNHLVNGKAVQRANAPHSLAADRQDKAEVEVEYRCDAVEVRVLGIRVGDPVGFLGRCGHRAPPGQLAHHS